MTTCPICGAESSLNVGSRLYRASYANHDGSTFLKFYTCSFCGSELDLDYEEKNEAAIKKLTEKVRNDSVSHSLVELEKELSLVDIERSFSLPPKTLSKWKNQSKAPSAAAAALVSLLTVFPWLSYVGMTNYDPVLSYKVAGAAVLKELAKNPNNYPFAISNENYSAIGVINERTKNYTDTLVTGSIFGGTNYVN